METAQGGLLYQEIRTWNKRDSVNNRWTMLYMSLTLDMESPSFRGETQNNIQKELTIPLEIVWEHEWEVDICVGLGRRFEDRLEVWRKHSGNLRTRCARSTQASLVFHCNRYQACGIRHDWRCQNPSVIQKWAYRRLDVQYHAPLVP